MARYRALERGYIPVVDVHPISRLDNTGRRVVSRLVEPGEVFEFTGKPGKWMEPVKKGEVSEVEVPNLSGTLVPNPV